MKKIASFTVNHDTMKKGMYVSRIDGDVITYDIRMRLPNGGEYLPNATMHTFEHLFATFARNSAHADNVLYVGPMGCRTGFYLLLRSAVSKKEAVALVQDCFDKIAAYQGEIPGASQRECGNYLEHDLPSAKALGAEMRDVLRGWTEEKLVYPE
jgi:S-ribosylhomocysteine lyase